MYLEVPKELYDSFRNENYLGHPYDVRRHVELQSFWVSYDLPPKVLAYIEMDEVDDTLHYYVSDEVAEDYRYITVPKYMYDEFKALNRSYRQVGDDIRHPKDDELIAFCSTRDYTHYHLRMKYLKMYLGGKTDG